MTILLLLLLFQDEHLSVYGESDVHLRVNITIVYELIVCAMSAFSMCMLRVVFNVILF